MDDADNLDIEINGLERNENIPYSFIGIPAEYNQTIPLSSFTSRLFVRFSRPVELKFLQISPATGSLPENVTIILVLPDFTRLTDAPDPIRLKDNRFELPDGVFVEEVGIIIVSSSKPDLTLMIDFLGCVPPSMLYTLFTTLKKCLKILFKKCKNYLFIA